MNILIVDLLLDLAGELIDFLIPDRKEKKWEKHIKRLKEEPWFNALEKDWRYEYIIYNNRMVKKFLASERNIKMITSMDEERENFIQLVKAEHEKYSRLY
ncbi:hypothetical protein [Neobacillus muris]|uniref:hypothetical protein n=1 Tax=Neobacillus muris TaxID=2941334 RepID=UPI00203EFA27|nr:hypothetical protein [Neobacillus muris]